MKKKVIAKAKRKKQIEKLVDPKEAARREREIKKAIATFDEQVDERYEYAKRVYDAQDESTQAAIDAMVAVMKNLAGPPVFKYNGSSINSDNGWAERAQEKQFIWFAVRMITACAEFDIRIAKFTPLKGRCAKDGKRMK